MKGIFVATERDDVRNSALAFVVGLGAYTAWGNKE